MSMPNVPLERWKYSLSDINLNADGWDEPIIIRNEFIRSYSQINDYDNAVSPKIQLVCTVEKEYYETIITNMNTLTVNFTISKMNMGLLTNSNDFEDMASELTQDMSYAYNISLKAASDDKISTTNANRLMNDEELIDASLSDTSQQTVALTLLLYDNNNITKYKKNSYHIVRGSKNDILYDMFKTRGFSNILMTPTDSSSDTYALPYGHLGQNLKSLNTYYGIYKTPYLFFMDLTTTYLIEKGTVGNTLRKGELRTVSIYLEKQTDNGYLMTGSYEDKDDNMYILNTQTFDISDNDSIVDYALGGTLHTVVAGTGTINTEKFGDYDVDRIVVLDNSMQHSQMKYIMNEQKRNLILTFSNIDLNILTPNKVYTIIDNETFYKSSYDIRGNYRLTNMRFVMSRTNENEFNSSVQITLCKIQ